MTQISLGDISVDVIFKDIKNVHLSVHPPAGRVSVAAPERMSLETIRLFAILKLDWIKRQKKKMVGQERETPREFVNEETHYLWGKRYRLQVVSSSTAPVIEIKHSHLVLKAKSKLLLEKRQQVMAGWYRDVLKTEVAALIVQWAPILEVEPKQIFVQKMKTKWGSCNASAGSIRFNTELAKKPKECVEYVVVHELMHLIEPTHNARFVRMMNKAMPNWQILRDHLNDLPVGYDETKRP